MASLTSNSNLELVTNSNFSCLYYYYVSATFPSSTNRALHHRNNHYHFQLEMTIFIGPFKVDNSYFKLDKFSCFELEMV